MLNAVWGGIYDLGMDENADGSLMSHVTVECNAKGYPVELLDSKEEKFIYVEE